MNANDQKALNPAKNPAASLQRQGGRFLPGQSGNPGGRAAGSRHRATLAAEALLDGEVEKLTRKAVDLALAGDTVALRLCLERILPARKDRPVIFALPAIGSPADIVVATAALMLAASDGSLTPNEAAELGRLVDIHTRAVEVVDLDARLRAIEAGGRQ